MKTTNMPSGAQRNTDVGLVWKEVLSGAAGTIQVPMQGSIRVRAVGATTVTIGGVLAATMIAGEIIIFNAGTGPADGKSTVAVIITGAPFVQVAEEVEAGRNQR